MPLTLAIVFASWHLGQMKPLAVVPKFDGKFAWIKLANVSPASMKSLVGARTMSLTLSFPKAVSLKPDKAGNRWFTFLLADQGSDWKWHQTAGYGTLPLVGGALSAGKHVVTIPLAGIPASVLKEAQQTLSIGPGSSGLDAPIAFTVESVVKG